MFCTGEQPSETLAAHPMVGDRNSIAARLRKQLDSCTCPYNHSANPRFARIWADKSREEDNVVSVAYASGLEISGGQQ